MLKFSPWAVESRGVGATRWRCARSAYHCKISLDAGVLAAGGGVVGAVGHVIDQASRVELERREGRREVEEHVLGAEDRDEVLIHLVRIALLVGGEERDGLRLVAGRVAQIGLDVG